VVEFRPGASIKSSTQDPSLATVASYFPPTVTKHPGSVTPVNVYLADVTLQRWKRELYQTLPSSNP
jgi:hypothetical protein